MEVRLSGEIGKFSDHLTVSGVLEELGYDECWLAGSARRGLVGGRAAILQWVFLARVDCC